MRLHAALTALTLVAAIPAQQGEGPKPVPEQTKSQQKLAQKVREQRDAMRAGTVRRYNVFVRVRLKNGNRLKGVVKDGQFVEKNEGLDFETAAKDTPGAGLRVWFTAGTNSFIFIPHSTIKDYRIGRTLSDDQVKAIELSIAKKKRELEDKQKLAQTQKQGDQPGNPPAQPGGAGATDTTVPGLTPEQKKLLEEFPPEEGWGEKKLASLKLRRITLGVYPSPKEKQFEESFEAWNKAFQAQEAAKAAARQADREKAQKALIRKPAPAPAPVPQPGGELPPGGQPPGGQPPGGKPPVQSGPPMPGK